MQKTKLVTIISIALMIIGTFLILTSLPFAISVKETSKGLYATFSDMLSDMQIEEAGKVLVRTMRIHTIIGLIIVVCGIGLLRLKNWARNALLIVASAGTVYLIYLIHSDLFIKQTFRLMIFRIIILLALFFILIIFNLKNIKKLFTQYK